jgi:hypothetical protein
MTFKGFGLSEYKKNCEKRAKRFGKINPKVRRCDSELKDTLRAHEEGIGLQRPKLTFTNKS